MVVPKYTFYKIYTKNKKSCSNYKIQKIPKYIYTKNYMKKNYRKDIIKITTKNIIIMVNIKKVRYIHKT